MSTQFPSEQYTRFASPDRNSPPPEQWAKDMLDNQKLLNVGRRKIALFDNFPPEYVDYYKALQEEIAKRIPAEQDRPFICLNLKGRNRVQDQSPADVGMAGGTGPLSDATALENLVRHMSHVGHSSLADHRDEVATRMENFSGVMYSMSPFRDLSHAYDDFNAYRSLYKSVRENLPCSSLHILTNTGHSNKWVFDSKLFFGNKKFGHVDDMTVRVTHRIKQESAPGEGVLILGTVAADKAQLYLRLLDKRELSPAVPTELYKEQDAKLYLQLIIDQGASLRPTTLARGKSVDALTKKTP